MEEAAANFTTSGNQQGSLDGGAANSTAVSANVPKCEDGSSMIGMQYTKPVPADCTALSRMLRASPAASHEQLITRQEKFLRRSGTCQLSIITHPMIRPSQDYASFNDLADGIDSVLETCVCYFFSVLPIFAIFCDILLCRRREGAITSNSLLTHGFAALDRQSEL